MWPWCILGSIILNMCNIKIKDAIQIYVVFLAVLHWKQGLSNIPFSRQNHLTFNTAHDNIFYGMIISEQITKHWYTMNNEHIAVF